MSRMFAMIFFTNERLALCVDPVLQMVLSSPRDGARVRVRVSIHMVGTTSGHWADIW